MVLLPKEVLQPRWYLVAGIPKKSPSISYQQQSTDCLLARVLPSMTCIFPEKPSNQGSDSGSPFDWERHMAVSVCTAYFFPATVNGYFLENVSALSASLDCP